MRNMILSAFAVASIASGCRSVSVENYGQDYVRNDAGGALLVGGKPIVFSKGWEVDYFQHWMITKADSVNASVKPEEIVFSLNGLSSDPDSDGLAKVVKESLSGAADLAAKIGAAVASSGGSIGADVIYGYVKQFVSNGGDTSKASVTISDGKLTCTDGTCTVTGSCADGSCSE